MKFLFHFYDLHQKAGIQRAICELSNAMIQEGHEVIVYSNTPRNQIAYGLNNYVVVETCNNPEPQRTGFSAWSAKLLWAVRQWSPLRKMVLKYRPDMVVDHGTALGLLYPLARLGGVPFALQRHFPGRNFPHGWALYRAISAFSIAKTMVVLTDAIASDMRLLGFKNVPVIPNPTPSNAHYCPYEEATPRLGLLMGRAGNPQKGFDLFLEALALHRIEGWQFQIVGPGVDTDPLLHELVTQYHLEGDVKLLAATADPYRLIREASCLIMPSRYEGLPMVALEALSIGRPVVAANVDGLRELVVQGVNGILFQSGSAAHLSAALLTMAADFTRLDSLAKNAPASIDGFRPNVIVLKWCELVHSFKVR